MCYVKRMAVLSLVVWCLGGGVSFGLTAYIPHLTPHSASWASYLQVDNSNTSAASFTLTLYNNGIAVYQGTLSVNGLSEKSFLIDFQNTSLCGVITYSDPQLNFRCTYVSSGGGMAEFALTGDRFQTLGCYFSDLSSSITWKGMALTNFTSTLATLTLYAIGGGSILGSTTISINPNSKVGGLYTQWFPSINFSTIKKIVAVSNTALCGVVISGDSSNSRLLFTPASELSSFTGSAPTMDLTGTWRGTWNSLATSVITRASSGQITAQVTQQGSNLTGTLALTSTDCGNIQGIALTGTVSGNTASFNASYYCQSDLASLAFTTGVIASNTMTGTYQTNVNGAYYDHGTFTLTKY